MSAPTRSEQRGALVACLVIAASLALCVIGAALVPGWGALS